MYEKSKHIVIQVRCTEDLRTRFKSICALERKTMNQVLLEYIEEFVSDREGIQPILPKRSE